MSHPQALHSVNQRCLYDTKVSTYAVQGAILISTLVDPIMAQNKLIDSARRVMKGHEQ